MTGRHHATGRPPAHPGRLVFFGVLVGLLLMLAAIGGGAVPAGALGA